MVAIAKEKEYYASYGPGLQDPFDDSVEADISVGDHTFAIIPKALWIGGSGDLKYVTARGTTVTRVNIVGGTSLPVRAQKIIKVGTTCTDILGDY